jgi:hypothetical protein
VIVLQDATISVKIDGFSDCCKEIIREATIVVGNVTKEDVLIRNC